MRGREIVHALSVLELLSLCVWCILALLLKLVNLGFAGLDSILGKRFDEVRAPPDNGGSRTEVRTGERLALHIFDFSFHRLDHESLALRFNLCRLNQTHARSRRSFSRDHLHRVESPNRRRRRMSMRLL